MSLRFSMQHPLSVHGQQVVVCPFVYEYLCRKRFLSQSCCNQLHQFPPFTMTWFMHTCSYHSSGTD